MRGFEMILRQGNTLSLPNLFSNIQFNDCQFHVVDSEIFENNSQIQNGSEYVKAVLSTCKEYPNNWILKLVMHVYPKNAKPVPIYSYKDFLDSDCQLILLVCDVTYIEVYVKETVWLMQLLTNAEYLPLQRLEMKTDQTDMRTVMLV